MEFEDNDERSYVIIIEPSNEYFTHVTPNSGYGKEIAKAIHEFLVEKNLKNQPIVCVGSDGTNVNVSSAGGTIYHLEMLLGHSLHLPALQNWAAFSCRFYKNDNPEH